MKRFKNAFIAVVLLVSCTPVPETDLVITGANPLDDIRNTRSLEVVISEGNVIDREALLRKGK